MTDLPSLNLKINLSENLFFIFPPLFQYVIYVESVLSDISYSVLCKDEFEVPSNPPTVCSSELFLWEQLLNTAENTLKLNIKAQ